MSTNLTIFGTCLTILGAFFLMLSIVVKSPRTIMRELLGMKVDRLKTFKYFIAQRLEAMLGFLCILLGSSLTLYSDLAEKSARHHIGVYLVVTILVMSIIGLLLYRSCSVLSRWIFIRLFRSHATRHRVPIHRDEDLLKELGEILEIPRDEEETIETYARKIRDRLELDYKPRNR
jgi:hypothetical protein